MPASLGPLAKSRLKARSAAKNLSIPELEKLISNLNAVLKTEKERAKTKAEASKKAKIAKIQALMSESGLKPSDLKLTGRGRGRKKAVKKSKVAPKYRLVVEGVEYKWSGRGRPPRVFKEYMEAGNSKESCAI
ncbi:MAG: H-NS histone family protein [Pseudomonadota bacterium]